MPWCLHIELREPDIEADMRRLAGLFSAWRVVGAVRVINTLAAVMVGDEFHYTFRSIVGGLTKTGPLCSHVTKNTMEDGFTVLGNRPDRLVSFQLSCFLDLGKESGWFEQAVVEIVFSDGAGHIHYRLF